VPGTSWRVPGRVVLTASLASVISNDRFPHEALPGHGLQWPRCLLASMPCCPHGRSRATTSTIQLASQLLAPAPGSPSREPGVWMLVISINTGTRSPGSVGPAGREAFEDPLGSPG
jgi:hypothetical protein